MPVYEYRCASCGATYEIYHKRAEIIEDVVCPSCKSFEHKKLMSASVPMKGSSASDSSCGGGECDSGGCCGGGCSMD